MFVTAVCFLFLLKWPKNKNFYDVNNIVCFLDLSNLNVMSLRTLNWSYQANGVKIIRAPFVTVINESSGGRETST